MAKSTQTGAADRALSNWFEKHHAHCMFQLPMSGDVEDPRGYIEGYLISAQIVIVRRYPQPGGGWDLFTSHTSNDIATTLEDAERRLGLVK